MGLLNEGSGILKNFEGDRHGGRPTWRDLLCQVRGCTAQNAKFSEALIEFSR